MSRRSLLLGAAASAGVRALSRSPEEVQAKPAPGKLKICVFSKHFHWTSVGEAAAMAQDIGFDGMDLTVRADGHVLPERVETDLPKAVGTIRRAGLEVPMITTEITGVTTPHSEAMLRTASQLGIRHYRWGGLIYPPDQSIEERLDQLKPQVRALADLNQDHQICGMYHTHSGPGLVGAPIWDLWTIFRDLDPRWIGINYDIGHATVEGGFGEWIATSRLLKDGMRGIALKDFTWQPNRETNRHRDPFEKSLNIETTWVPEWCATGQGMVNFPGFFAIVKANSFSGPVQLHFEYPGLGGAENGEKQLRIAKHDLIAAMSRDLKYVRGVMSAQRLIG